MNQKAQKELTMILDGSLDVFAAHQESVLLDIRNCLLTLVKTIRGTAPLNRHLGLTWRWIDAPAPVAMQQFRADLIDAINRYEPRVNVISVSFKKSEAQDGTLTPILRFRLKDGATA